MAEDSSFSDGPIAAGLGIDEAFEGRRGAGQDQRTFFRFLPAPPPYRGVVDGAILLLETLARVLRPHDHQGPSSVKGQEQGVSAPPLSPPAPLLFITARCDLVRLRRRSFWEGLPVPSRRAVPRSAPRNVPELHLVSAISGSRINTCLPSAQGFGQPLSEIDFGFPRSGHAIRAGWAENFSVRRRVPQTGRFPRLIAIQAPGAANSGSGFLQGLRIPQRRSPPARPMP